MSASSRAEAHARERRTTRLARFRESHDGLEQRAQGLRREIGSDDEYTRTHPAPARSVARATRPARQHTPSAASYIARHRLRRQQDDNGASMTVQDAVNQLDEANSVLNTALNEPLPLLVEPTEYMFGYPIGTAAPAPTWSFHDYVDDIAPHRRKRQRFDSKSPLGLCPNPKYEHKGKAVPGRLKMHIGYCDGGSMASHESRIPGGTYVVENVLQKDNSVYCSAKSRCNIILKHGENTPFHVTKIVIKTPQGGYTAPVQEGMLFVAMDSDDLLFRTAHYQIRNPPPPPLEHSDVQGNTDSPLRTPAWASEYFPQHYRLSPPPGPRPPSRRAPFPSATAVRVADLPRAASSYSTDQDSTPVASHDVVAESNPALTSTANNHDASPHYSRNTFRVNTTSSPASSDTDELLHFPSGWYNRWDHSSRQRPPGLPGEDFSDYSDSGSDTNRRRARHLRTLPRRIEWVDPCSEADKTEDGKRSVDWSGRIGEPEPLVPHATFYIEGGKSTVTIKFAPAVAGRAVLIKMWAPPGTKNIDIQNIGVYGYGGPRVFPALHML